MDKIAFYSGYMEKEAKFESLITPLAMTMIPATAAYPVGMAASKFTSPSPAAVKKLQAEYVRKEMEQALEDLERTGKLEHVRKELKNGGKSLRI
jgi:hypothetical protein